MMHLASMILMLSSLAVAPDVQEPSSVTRCQAGFPKKVYAPPAQYPAPAAKAHIGAVVLLEVTVGTDGLPEKVVVLRGHPMLDEAAVQTVKAWRYEPPAINGVPKRVVVVEPLGFFRDQQKAEDLLKEWATDQRQTVDMRVWAISGLRGVPKGRQEAVAETLRTLLNDPDTCVAKAAELALTKPVAPVPAKSNQNLGGLYFDPQGADFTAWINHFKNEVYRNWIAPQAALFGAARGHVDFEFTVERNGTMSGLRMLKSSGTTALDKAAQFALTSSHWTPLPDDYGPPRVTMQVAFYYNEAPQGS